MKKLLLFALALTMVGCVNYKVHVTKFHTFGQNTEQAFALNKTFDVLPLDKQKKGSLGFEAKAKLVAVKLEQYGMRREKKTPELYVFLEYSIGGERTMVEGDAEGVTSYTVRTRRLSIDIVDAKASTDNVVKKIYEARVVSTGTSGVIDEVVPYLIEAVFKDFPGVSGTTEKFIINEGDLELTEP